MKTTKTTKTVTAIKIEKGIAIPSKGLKSSKYPFQEMEVGDSFALPYSKTTYSSLYQASKTFSKSHPEHKFTIRKTDSDVRIWRIKKK